MPKVLIIGAGLGGLGLAQYLRAHDIDFEIFERDESIAARVQGWAIVLVGRTSAGLRAIAGPSAPPLASVSVTRFTGHQDEAVIYDENSTEALARLTGDSHSFLRANRRRIRTWLTNDLPIQWGKHYASHTIDDNSDGQCITVSFEDGTTATGDILVGADGVGSRVRASFDPTPLPPLPIGLIVGETIVDGELCARLRALGNSFYAVSTDSFRLLVGLRDTAPDLSWGEYYWLFFWREPLVAEQGLEQRIMKASQEERLQYVKDRLHDADVNPKMWEIVAKQKPEGIYPSFVLRDRVPTMCPEGPVTLLGDAAHAMTPLQGQGANNALTDAFDLGKLLVERRDISTKEEISELLRDYERSMIPRATFWVLESRKSGVMFREDLVKLQALVNYKE